MEITRASARTHPGGVVTIEVRIVQWGTGTAAAAISLNGHSPLRTAEINSCDLIEFMAMLSVALRSGDVLRVFLPKPSDRVGMNEFDLGWFHRLAARGVEVCAQDSYGTVHRIAEYDDLPVHEDVPPPAPPKPACVVMGRHTWDENARVGDLCACGLKILRSTAQREAAL
jgi:hypothetical protein